MSGANQTDLKTLGDVNTNLEAGNEHLEDANLTLEALLSGQGAATAVLSDIEGAVRHFKIGNPIYDAFSRLRVSNPVTIFESKLVVSESDLLWDWGQVSGSGGSATYNRNRASVVITQSANSTGKFTRRTRRYFNYQPGKSQLVVTTCVPGPAVAGVTKRIGYFDESNGIFFGVDGGGVFVCIRSNVTGTPVDRVVRQSAWNMDKLDGTGSSGITLDPTLVQIFWTDLEWLGAGRVRCGIFYRGVPYVCHEFEHSNEPGFSSVYMSTPVLPVTAEVENDGTGGAASLEQICTTVVSEGGSDIQRAVRAVSRQNSGLSAGAGVLVPVLSLRTRPGFEFTTIDVIQVDIIGTGNTAFEWQLLLNPTIAGVDAAVWTNVPSSTAQFDVSRTVANVVSGGSLLDTGYANANTRQVLARPENFLGLGRRLLGSSPKDEIVVACRNFTGSNTFYAALTYGESV